MKCLNTFFPVFVALFLCCVHHSTAVPYRLAPLYRYYKGEHFYTTNIHEIGTATPGRQGNHGYVSEGVQCIIHTRQDPNTIPLYRYWNGRDHFYTTNSNEIGVTTPGHVGNHNYRSEGITGYCYPSHQWFTVPLYRYWNGNEHFYTTNLHEIGTNTPGHTGNHNYRSEGIACHVLQFGP